MALANCYWFKKKLQLLNRDLSRINGWRCVSTLCIELFQVIMPLTIVSECSKTSVWSAGHHYQHSQHNQCIYSEWKVNVGSRAFSINIPCVARLIELRMEWMRKKNWVDQLCLLWLVLWIFFHLINSFKANPITLIFIKTTLEHIEHRQTIFANITDLVIALVETIVKIFRKIL